MPKFLALYLNIHFYDIRYTLRVEPLGPISLCLLFTNLSVFLTSDPILIISQALSSSKILSACNKNK